MRKSPTTCSDSYKSGNGGRHITIFSNDDRNLVAVDCPNMEPLFGIFMQGAKLRMGIVRRQDFGISTMTLLLLQNGWEKKWMV